MEGALCMIEALTSASERELYDFFTNNRHGVPYYFPTDFDTWRESLLNDTGYDGTPLFKETATFLLRESGAIWGFIQLAVTAFAFAANGTEDRSLSYGIIRNLYFLPGCANSHLLMACATDYFGQKGVDKPYAFFHYFGMSCYARQGKLHESAFHIETLLKKYGYKKEHENIYFSKQLSDDFVDDPEIAFAYTGETSLSFQNGTEKIGGCELYFVPHSTICFLKWIYVDKALSHKGYGTRCMKKLFYALRQKGISQLDTDTADSNVIAQNYYHKMGFSHRGTMRSYLVL